MNCSVLCVVYSLEALQDYALTRFPLDNRKGPEPMGLLTGFFTGYAASSLGIITGRYEPYQPNALGKRPYGSLSSMVKVRSSTFLILLNKRPKICRPPSIFLSPPLQGSNHGPLKLLVCYCERVVLSGE